MDFLVTLSIKDIQHNALSIASQGCVAHFSIVMLIVVMLNVVMLNVVMLNVIMLNVVTLNVVAPIN